MNMRKMEVRVKSNSLKFLGALVIMALVGCARCQECTLNSNTETICETEFDNPQQYEEAIADREAAGATCTSSGGF